LVHHTIKDKFIKHTIEEIEKHLVQIQRNLPILLNCQFKNWQRQINLLENQEILYGGKSIKKLLHCPTLLNEPKMDSLVMKEEILDQFSLLFRLKRKWILKNSFQF
jgi:aldehyde dehydrogenase (NAD+)